MEQEQYEAMTRPQAAKLRATGKGLRIGKVSGTRLLVKLVKPWTEMDEVEKKGLLVLPETAKEARRPLPSVGVIVELGTGIYNDYDKMPEAEMSIFNDLRIKDGDAVMFSKFAGSDVTVEEEDFRILDYKEILCTLEFTDPLALGD